MQKVNSNIDELISQLKVMRENVLTSGRFADALVASLNTGMGLMKRRIFNLSEDVNGKSLGSYSVPYAKKRKKAGRQTESKDEEFTGSLRRSIEVVIIDNRVVNIEFVNQTNADIAGYQEQQLQTEIFSLSKEEFEVVEVQALRLFKQIIEEL